MSICGVGGGTSSYDCCGFRSISFTNYIDDIYIRKNDPGSIASV